MVEAHKNTHNTNLKRKIIGTILYLLFGLLFSVIIAFILAMFFEQQAKGFSKEYGDGLFLFILWVSGIFSSWGWVTINKLSNGGGSSNNNENNNPIAMLMVWLITIIIKLCFSIFVGMFVAPKKFYELYTSDSPKVVKPTSNN